MQAGVQAHPHLLGRSASVPFCYECDPVRFVSELRGNLAANEWCGERSSYSCAPLVNSQNRTSDAEMKFDSTEDRNCFGNECEFDATALTNFDQIFTKR
jgi:hypothetical protein